MDNNIIFYLGFIDISLEENNNEPVKIKNDITEQDSIELSYRCGKRRYNDKAYATCYCRHCKKSFVSDDLLNRAYYYNSVIRNNLVVTCPDCGASVKYVNMKHIDTLYMLYREWFIQDEDKIRIKFKTIEYKYFRHRLVPITYSFMYTINMKTGMSYEFAMLKNGKSIGHKRMRNCTYSNIYSYSYTIKPYSDKCRSAEDVFEEIFNHIRAYKLKHSGFYIPTIDEHFPDYRKYKEESVNGIPVMPWKREYKGFAGMQFEFALDTLFMFNRIPSLNPCLAKKIYSDKYVRYATYADMHKLIAKMRHMTKIDDKDALKSIMAVCDMPCNKKNKDRIREEGINYIIKFTDLRRVMSLDNVYKLIDILDHSIRHLSEYFEHHPVDTKTMNNICNKIVRKYERDRRVNNYSLSSSTFGINILITDIFNTLRLIDRHDANYTVDWRMDLQDIHDTVASEYNHYKHQNIAIKYDHLNKDYSGIYGDLTFNLAKDTHELIDVGQYMSICVGGYGDRAIEHHCYIVVARDNNNKPVICIEINNERTRLEQTKMKYNELPTPEIAELIKQWCADYGLDYNSCHDMNERNIKQAGLRRDNIVVNVDVQDNIRGERAEEIDYI